MHDGIGRAYITLDGKDVYNMCTLKRDYYRNPREGFYAQVEFLETLHEYLNTPIEELLKSDNTLIKALVLLDKRVGKRTLESKRSSIVKEEEVVQYFYKLRCQSDGIRTVGLAL
jgi:hypothetical protein